MSRSSNICIWTTNHTHKYMTYEIEIDSKIDSSFESYFSIAVWKIKINLP